MNPTTESLEPAATAQNDPATPAQTASRPTRRAPLSMLRPNKPVELTCRECGGKFILEFDWLAKWVAVCPLCSERRIDAANKADAARASAPVKSDRTDLKHLVPAAFRDTMAFKLPFPTKLHRVLEWKFGPKGLIFVGPTGSGKSRCLYELLKREYKVGRSIAVLDSTSGYRYASEFADSNSALHWIEHKCNVDILAMDDVFKVKITDSFEQALFTIIRSRTEREKPLLITTNDVGVTLEGRMSDDRGPAIVRRLREFCDLVSFV